MQKKYGFSPLGPADGMVKNAIFGDNSAKLYYFSQKQRAELKNDWVHHAKLAYEASGEGRTNLRYGYLQKSSSS